jgi:hypothetical protein
MTIFFSVGARTTTESMDGGNVSRFTGMTKESKQTVSVERFAEQSLNMKSRQPPFVLSMRLTETACDALEQCVSGGLMFTTKFAGSVPFSNFHFTESSPVSDVPVSLTVNILVKLSTFVIAVVSGFAKSPALVVT